jgi:hypothetical protein
MAFEQDPNIQTENDQKEIDTAQETSNVFEIELEPLHFSADAILAGL